MKTKVENFILAWNEVPVLAEIIRIVETKKFTDPGDPKEFGHMVIGVMSPLVRGMYTFLEANGKALVAAKNETIMGLPFSCPGLGLDCIAKIDGEIDECPHASALLKIKESHPLAAHQDFIRQLMFSLIKTSLPNNGEDLSGVALVENFRIASSEVPPSYPPAYELFEGWEEMTLEELVAVSITGTFLQPLAEILETGQFVEHESPVVDGESLIRMMKPLEKAITTKIELLTEGMKAKEEEHNRLLQGENFIKKPRPNIDFASLFGGLATMISIDMSDDAPRFSFEPKDPSHLDCIRVAEIKKELHAVASSVEPYQEMSWPLIKMDIDPEKKDGFDGIGIRAGFQIVAFNKPVEVE